MLPFKEKISLPKTLREIAHAEEAGVRIAIVEDDSVMAWLLEEACQSSGHQIVGVAPVASAAVPLIKRTRPDCLLLDYQLDGEHNGVEVLEQAKHIQPSLFTIMITAWDVNDIADRLGPVQPDRILRKPIHIETLLSILEKAERSADPESTPPPNTPRAYRLQLQRNCA